MAADILSIAVLGLPMAVGVVGTVAGVGLSVVRPRWLIFGYLIILLSFGVSSFGVADAGDSPSIWSRGSGQLYYSFVEYLVVGMWIALLVSGRFRGEQQSATALHKWFYVIAFLWLGHLAVAVLTDEGLFHAANSRGFANLITGPIFFSLLLRAFGDQASVERLVRFLLIVILIKGVFGLVRFAAFGGDPANVYANFNRIAIRLTYFDSNESFLATVAAFIAGWTVMIRGSSLTTGARLFYWSIVLIELAIVVFSYRRAAWGGLMLAAVLFVAVLPSAQRWKVIVAGLPVVLLGIVVAAGQRLGDSVGSRGWFSAFFEDVGGGNRFTALGHRELELRLGMNSFLENPIFGNGSWSRYYDGYVRIDWQVGPDAFYWTHSSVLHLAFKTGLVGLALVAGLVATFFVWVVRHGNEVAIEWRGVYYAGMAGLLFQIPAFAYAPSVIEFRTMQLIFLSMALPFIVHRIASVGVPVSIGQPYSPSSKALLSRRPINGRP